MDKLLRNALMAGVLLAGGGVFYHFVIYLPGVERAKQEQMAEERRIKQEEREAQQRDAAAKERSKQLAYEQCKSNAAANYLADWAAACTSVAHETAGKLRDCLASPSIAGNQFLGESYCKRTFAETDAGPECSLPAARAETLNIRHRDAKDRCLNEAKSGL